MLVWEWLGRHSDIVTHIGTSYVFITINVDTLLFQNDILNWCKNKKKKNHVHVGVNCSLSGHTVVYFLLSMRTIAASTQNLSYSNIFLCGNGYMLPIGQAGATREASF